MFGELHRRDVACSEQPSQLGSGGETPLVAIHLITHSGEACRLAFVRWLASPPDRPPTAESFNNSPGLGAKLTSKNPLRILDKHGADLLIGNPRLSQHGHKLQQQMILALSAIETKVRPSTAIGGQQYLRS